MVESGGLLEKSLTLVVLKNEAVVAVSGVHAGADIAPHGILAAVVGQKGQPNVAAVLVHQATEISESDPQVRPAIEQLLTGHAFFDLTSRAGHELGQADRSDLADGVSVELALASNEPEGQLGIDPLAQRRVEDIRRHPSGDPISNGVVNDPVGAIVLRANQTQLTFGRRELIT